LIPWPLGAQEPVTVEVAIFPPNVMESPHNSEELAGFDIDLWKEIAHIAKIEYVFRRVPFDELIRDIEAAEPDARIVGLAGITVKEEREERMDFSHPYMRSGLRILAQTDTTPQVIRLGRVFLDSGASVWMMYLVAFLILCSHLLFFAERNTRSLSNSYIPGIFEAAWCVLATMTTVGYGDITPHSWRGRIAAFLVMVTGIGLFGIVVAEMSAGLTLQQLSSDILGPEDLRGKTIATVAGSTSVNVASRFGARVLERPTIDEAYEEARSGAADAVVFDAPTLLYYMTSQQPADLGLAGETFDEQVYAIAFPAGSELREPVNRALLRIQESGVYDRIYQKWFGTAR
jgi:ABC-type amino acid transport substrate-binding protein